MATAAYIYDAVRTPRSKGKLGGALNEVKPVDLAAGLLKGLSDRHDLDTSRVGDVIMGCVAPLMDQGSCITKSAVQVAGWDECVPGFQLDRFCASGLEAVNLAAARVGSGQEDLVVAGGLEAMSRVPIGSSGGPIFADVDFVLDQRSISQGVGADLIAALDGYSREDVDRYAIESQRRAGHARDSGWFDRSVMPVKDRNGQIILERDDFIRPDTDMETLGALKPSFEVVGKAGFDEMAISRYPQVLRIDHIHTPGNSSGIVDGASAVLVGNEQVGRDLGLTPRGRVVATAVLATDPRIMVAGTGPAAKKWLAKAGMTESDIDLWEINEAFASVAMRYMKDLGVTHEVTNVNGGAIAMG
ncbi:MAG: acetyl-CoA C-acetyltransferase, partial [Nitratireductor sp.]|nr:acetyl-CoA C-acetyltransferase [Nitratireductor sp.]